MARIQANTGLVTGLPIQETVDKLIALEAKPRDMLTARLKQLTTRQTALADMTASVIAIQLAAKNLGKPELFRQTALVSSNPAVLSATASPSGSPLPGTYQFTPWRLAQAQHALSQGFSSKTAPVGAGVLTLRDGGELTNPARLSQLNGGSGVSPGKLRITDRSGASAVIDLRHAQTIEDVLTAINGSDDIRVTASTSGDRIQLTDTTGETVGNLRVQEVGAGTTAADLGLDTINVVAASAAGNDILGLYSNLAVSTLRDGQGLSFNKALSDLTVTFRDGSDPLDIDLQRVAKEETQSQATLNAASGIHGDLVFTALDEGTEFDGVTITFIDSNAVTAGNETVVWNAQAMTLTFDIESGVTTANDVIAALTGDPTASAVFTAELGTGSTGNGILATSDSAITSGGAATEAVNELTIGDMLATINAADPSRLKAQISSSGDRIELLDLTSGVSNFSVTSLNGGSLAEELGLAQSTTSGTVAGRRLLGGLNTVLLSSLNGGQGYGTLGEIDLTDRSGATATINLAAAETLDDVLSAFNNSGIGIRASINDAANGIKVLDTTGSTISNLIVVNGDGTSTATKLGLLVNTAEIAKNSGDLHRQISGRQTALAEFNHRRGVRLGSLTIKDSNGSSSALNLNTLGAETLGDVIDAINNLTLGVTASINAAGDGLLLTDTAGGTGKLTVTDVGSGKAAADLKIVGQAAATTIDGSTTVQITLDADDSLTDLVAKINDADTGLTASIFSDGSASPHRLSLVNGETGRKNAWVIDGSGLDLQFDEVTKAQDALVAIGPAGSSLMVASGSNTIDDAIDGVRITLSGTSETPVNVSVAQDVGAITLRVKSFVDQYNKMLEKLNKYDFYTAESGAKGVLHGSSEALRLRSELARVLSGSFAVGGDLKSLGALGIGFKDDGTLELNESELTAAYSANPDDMEDLFTNTLSGVGKKIDDAVETLAGEDNSVLINRTIALQSQADLIAARIDFLTERLDKSKERLLLTFYRLESTIGKLQNTFGSIGSSLENAVSLYKNL